MKRWVFAVMFLAAVMIVSLPAIAQVDRDVDAGSPVTSEYIEEPPGTDESLEDIPGTDEYAEAPDVIPLPETDNVYVVPDLDVDVFFWNGWWWGPWEGGLYRARYYSRGWGHYRGIPTFYYDVDPGWRQYHRDRNWYGNPWYYERIHHRHLHQNWRQWHQDRHWERQRTWGIQDYRPRPQQQRQELRQQREREYYQRPEVRQYQQETEVSAALSAAAISTAAKTAVETAAAAAARRQPQIRQQKEKLRFSKNNALDPNENLKQRKDTSENKLLSDLH